MDDQTEITAEAVVAAIAKVLNQSVRDVSVLMFVDVATLTSLWEMSQGQLVVRNRTRKRVANRKGKLRWFTIDRRDASAANDLRETVEELVRDPETWRDARASIIAFLCEEYAVTEDKILRVEESWRVDSNTREDLPAARRFRSIERLYTLHCKGLLQKEIAAT